MNKSWVNLAKACPPSAVSAQAFAADSSGAEQAPGESEQQPGPSEDDTVGPREMPPLKGQYGTAQLQDLTLGNALRNVQVLEGTLVGARLTPSYPHFAVENGILYQVVKSNDKVIEQLLVPQPHRSTILKLAHTHLLGANLGVEKTKERVLQRFFWPGVDKLPRLPDHSTKTDLQEPPYPFAYHRNPI